MAIMYTVRVPVPCLGEDSEIVMDDGMKKIQKVPKQSSVNMPLALDVSTATARAR